MFTGNIGFGTSTITLATVNQGSMITTVLSGQVCGNVEDQVSATTGLVGNLFNFFDPSEGSTIMLANHSVQVEVSVQLNASLPD